MIIRAKANTTLILTLREDDMAEGELIVMLKWIHIIPFLIGSQPQILNGN